MRRRKGLVQIHMDDIEIHIAGSHLAENGVQIGTVVIKQAAGIVNLVGNILDMAFENAER